MTKKMNDHAPWTRLCTNNPPRLVNPARDKLASERMTKVMGGRVIESASVKDASEEGGVIFGWVTLTFTDKTSAQFKVSGLDAVMDLTFEKNA